MHNNNLWASALYCLCQLFFSSLFRYCLVVRNCVLDSGCGIAPILVWWASRQQFDATTVPIVHFKFCAPFICLGCANVEQLAAGL